MRFFACQCVHAALVCEPHPACLPPPALVWLRCSTSDRYTGRYVSVSSVDTELRAWAAGDEWWGWCSTGFDKQAVFDVQHGNSNGGWSRERRLQAMWMLKIE